MKIKSIARKVSIQAITILLTGGVIVAFGVLSASGMLALSPSLALYIGAFIFGGVVEGEVFRQEILEGLEDLALLGKKGYRHLVNNSLNRNPEIKHAIKNLDAEVPAGFLGDYVQLRRFLNTMRGRKLTAHFKAEKKRAQKRLKQMEKFFAKSVLSQRQNPLFATPFAKDERLQQLITTTRNEIPTYKVKMTIFRIALPLSIICGIGFGFAAASALPAALAGISVALAPLVWPLAVIAAIGYTFLIFHTVKDLLLSDAFQKWKKRVKLWFAPPENGITWRYVAKIIGMALVTLAIVSLCVFATVATAGTWWTAVKNGAQLLTKLQAAAVWIRNIMTPILALGNLIFSVFNSFESLHVVVKAIQTSKPVQAIKANWATLRAEENWLQILNPFRIVCKIIQKSMDTILLLGHTAATGAGRDQFLNISPAVLAAANAGTELTQDITFFFEKGKQTMTQKAITFLLTPLLLLAAGWQALASLANEGGKPKVAFTKAVKDAFGVVEKKAYIGNDAPPESPEWSSVTMFKTLKADSKKRKLEFNEDAAWEEAAKKVRQLEPVFHSPRRTSQHEHGQSTDTEFTQCSPRLMN